MRAQLLEFAIARAAQDSIEAALKPPCALRDGAFTRGLAAIKAAQLMEELLGHAELMDQTRDHVLEFSGVIEVPPLENPAKQIDAVLIGRLGEIQIVSRLFVYGGQRIVCF